MNWSTLPHAINDKKWWAPRHLSWFTYLYVSAMVAIGCGIEEYMGLNPVLMGRRGAETGGLMALTWSTERRWLRNFSSRRHFARLLLNQTCKKKKYCNVLSRPSMRLEYLQKNVGFLFVGIVNCSERIRKGYAFRSRKYAKRATYCENQKISRLRWYGHIRKITARKETITMLRRNITRTKGRPKIKTDHKMMTNIIILKKSLFSEQLLCDLSIYVYIQGAEPRHNCRKFKYYSES